MKLNILDSEEKIKNTDFKDADELIQAYYFFMKQNYVSDELHEFLLEKNEKFNMSIADFMFRVDDYGKMFNRKSDIFTDKVIKSSFIRRTVKDISKTTGNDISQSKLKKLIGVTLGLTASNISDLYYKLCFDDETMDNVFEMISDENILKNEFIKIISRSAVDTSLRMNNDEFEFEHCFTDILSKCYCDYYFNNHINIDKFRNELNDLSKMTNGEISYLYKKLNKKQDQIQEKYEKDEQEEYDQTIDELTEKIMPRVREKGIDLTVEEGKEHIKALLEGNPQELEEQFEAGKRIFDKTRDTINKYFLYEKEEDENFIRESFVKTTRAFIHKKDESKKDFFQMCAIYLGECYKTYEDEVLKDDDEDNEIYHYLITRDFMLFLTHHLLNGSEDFKQELLELCQNILSTNLVAANNYTDLMNGFDIAPHVLAYTPDQLNDCVIVMAVLKEIYNDKSIMRKIKRVLIKYYKNIYDNLAKANKEQHESYFEDNSALCDNERIHEYSVTFMFNYFKDPVFIAPLSAFIYEFEDVMESSSSYYYHNESMIEKIGVESEIKDIEFLKKAFDYYNEINRLVNKLDDLDLEEIDDVIVSKYTLLFLSSIQRDTLYDDFFDCGYMLHKYQKNLAFILSFENEQISYGFNEWYDEEKVELLWELAIQVSMIKEIYKSYKLIPKVLDLSKDDYTHSLEKTNNELIEKIKKEDTENLTLKNHIRSLNQIIQKNNNTKNDELEKNYNKEIHDLNKTIALQQKRIKELEESQDELHKLRTLMFELENQEDSNTKEDIDYEQALSEISGNKRIIFVGGHIKLLDVLKDKYPNMVFVGNRNTISSQLITNADYIFFFYNFLNHGLYHKIMGMINSNSHIKWDYISSKNLDLVEKDIYEKINKMSK